ncbi:hypothetical protein ABIE71_002254 [Bradyrhizobium diazoefficiens]
MSANVTFLGYTLPVGAGGVVEPPVDSAVHYTEFGWTVRFFEPELQLNLGGHVGPDDTYVRFVADIECEDVGGVWTPRAIKYDGQTPNFWLIPNQTISSHPIDVRLRVLDFQADDIHCLGVRAGKIVFQNTKHTWKTDPSSPLALGNTSIPIDLRNGEAKIDAGALQLLSSNIFGPRGRTTACFARSHISNGNPTVDISLGSPPASIRVLFAAATSKPLPLHVDLLDRSKRVVNSDNPMIAALSIADYGLEVELDRPGATTIAKAVTARAKGGNLRLFTHFLSDQANAPQAWTGPASLKLGIRAGDPVRPGSLVAISSNIALQPTGNANVIHGVASDARFSFQGAATLSLDTASEPNHPVPIGFDQAIAREITYPYLQWSNLPVAGVKPIAVMHAGRSNLPAQGQAIEAVSLSGSTLVLPLSDRARLVQTGSNGERHITFLDGLLGTPSYPLVQTSHDSGRVKLPPNGGSTMALTSLFSSGKPAYQPYGVVYQIGDRFTLECQDDGTINDFLVIGQNVNFTRLDLSDLLGVKASSPPFNLTGVDKPVTGILKLSRGITLQEICSDPRVKLTPPFSLDDPINGPNWVGLVIFNLSATANEDNALYALFGTAAFKMRYLAITAKDGANAFDFSAVLDFENASPFPAPTNKEANFRISRVSAYWRNSTLQKLDIDGTLNVARFLGLTINPPQQITIAGRYDNQAKAVRFASRFIPIELLPTAVQGAPISAFQIDSVDVTFGNGGAGIVADGSVTVSKFQLGSFAIDAPGDPVDFTGLAFPFPSAPGLSAIEIDIGYPSLRLNQDNLSFNWEFFQIALIGIGMIPDENSWLSVPALDIKGGGKPPNSPTASLTLSLSLMKLPALAAKSINRLTLNILVGMLPAGDTWDPNFWARIQAVDFKGLELDLLQFMTVKIRELKMEDKNNKHVEFNADGVEIFVLNEKIATVTVRIFNNAGESGFLAFVAPQPLSTWFEINWLLAAHNVTIPNNLAKELITINPQTGIDPDKLGTSLDQNLIPAPGGGNGRWLFGAGIHVATDVLVGQAVFQDEGFCGIALYSPLFKAWFNLNFAIGVAYRRGARPEQDSFFVAVTVPQVTLPAFDFMGGTISIEIAMNGDFKLDVGFPSLGPDGVARSWDRSFGAVVGILQGSGGFYLTKGTPGALQTVTGLRLGGGYAVQAGFGASFGAGIFSVVVTIGVYAIVEGEFVLDNGRLVQFTLTGAIGVLFRGVGQLDWWVISVTVSIVVAAEARATIQWASGSKLQIDFDFTVYASASAQACIGGRWFHLCKSISVSIPMRVHYPVQLGN